MDSISQIVLGGAIGEIVLGKKLGNTAILVGAIAGTIPDLDVVFSPFVSEATQLRLHRGPTHSVFFAFVAGPIIGFIFSKLFRNSKATLTEWISLFFWGLWTHPMLDIFTTYGTGFFEPFSNYRVALNSIFIIDPLYTVPLLLSLLAASVVRRESSWRRKFATFGLTISSLYLMWGLAVKIEIDNRIQASIEANGFEVNRFMSAPTFANSILWRGLVETEDAYLEGYTSLLGGSEITWTRFEKNNHLLTGLPESPFIETLRWFSKDYLHAYQIPQGDILVSDLRMGRFGFDDAPLVFTWDTESYKQRGTDPSKLGIDFGLFFDELFTRIKDEKKEQDAVGS